MDEIHSTAAREVIHQICVDIQHVVREHAPSPSTAHSHPEAEQDLFTDDLSTLLAEPATLRGPC